MADEKSTKKKTSTVKKSGTKKKSTKGKPKTKREAKTREQRIAETVVKLEERARLRPDSTGHPSVEDNSKFISHALHLAALPPCDMNNPEIVQERCMQYFEVCAEDGTKPSVAGLALALNTDRRRLWEIREGKVNKSKEVSDILKRCMQMLELQLVDYMQEGKVNPVVGIFMSKNHFGYKDQQDVVVAAQSALGDEKSAEEIRQRYIDSVADPGTIEGTASEISEK